MKLLGQFPPERSTSDVADSDPAYVEARAEYQADKDLALQKRVELLARLRRLGYDFDIVTRRHGDDSR